MLLGAGMPMTTTNGVGRAGAPSTLKTTVRPVDTDLRAAVRMASLAVGSIADGLLAGGTGSAGDSARRAALAGGRAAFLERRGLSPAGIAARLAVKGVFPEVHESEWTGELGEQEAEELEEELRRPPRHDREADLVRQGHDPEGHKGEVAAASGAASTSRSIPADHSKLLKVGKAIDFLDRPKDYGVGACFWLSSISIGSINPVGILEGVEHAVARTLMRMGHDLPSHDLPRPRSRP